MALQTALIMGDLAKGKNALGSMGKIENGMRIF